MKRRDFLTRGTAVAGLAGSTKLLEPLEAAQSAAAKTPAAQEEIRTAEYLQRAKQDKYLPKPPVSAESLRSSDVRISPMPMAARTERKIVPRRGFCSTAPASDALLISGNGPMSIDMPCDPYSEQISFRHESLFTPHRRPFEAPNIAGIFPQVRQMLSAQWRPLPAIAQPRFGSARAAKAAKTPLRQCGNFNPSAKQKAKTTSF